MTHRDTHITPARVDLHTLRIPDAIVISLIIVGAVFGLMGAGPGHDPTPRVKQAMIYRDGTRIEYLDLAQNREVPLSEGAMVLEIQDGRIRMKHSDCGRQFCVHQGWAAHNGETIICVPHKTVIEIQGEGRQPSVDAVIY